ncbi:MAG: M56 family metallopeptidase [Mariniphaga sp.]
MNTSITNFVIESGFSLTLFTIIYLVFLRKETFFMLNRIYLMGAVMISVLLPFVHIQVSTPMQSVMLEEVVVTAPRIQNLLETVTIYGTRISGSLEQTIQSIGWIRFIYITGMFTFSILLIYRLLQISRIVMNNQVEKRDGIGILKLDHDIKPFSFFGFIFISREQSELPGMKEMLAHESEHVRQGHSFDILILELLTIFQWFNPFIWLLKRSIRENHEFLADNGVLKPGVSSANYRLLLLNSSFNQQPIIANNFNYSLIKIRIKMMTKIKSSKLAASKLTMGILVTAALFMVFGFDYSESLPQEKKQTTSQKKDVQISEQTQDQVFVVVEQMPEFPGGEQALREFIAKEVKYPDDAIKAKIVGKVFVNFVVSKEGKVINPKVVRGVSPSLDAEALRVVKILPIWKPGQQKGVNVAVSYTIPIAFALK